MEMPILKHLFIFSYVKIDIRGGRSLSRGRGRRRCSRCGGGGEGIGPGVATGGVGAPAAGGEPAVATAGCVAVDGDEEDVVFAQLAAPLVHAAAALGQGDVRFLRHQERGVQTPGLEGGDDAAGKEPVLGVFQETAVGVPLALGVDAVAVVDQDFHSWLSA